MPLKPNAQIEDVDVRGQGAIKDGLERIVLTGEAAERNGAIEAASTPRRNRKHLKIGAPGDATEPVIAFRRNQAFGAGADDARHAGPVGILLPGFILRHQEEFLGHVSREQRVAEIEPGVDEPDGHARSGRRAKPHCEMDVRKRLARISHQRGVHGAETRGTGKKDKPLPAMTEPPHAHRLYLDATGV